MTTRRLYLVTHARHFISRSTVAFTSKRDAISEARSLARMGFRRVTVYCYTLGAQPVSHVAWRSPDQRKRAPRRSR